MSGFDNGVLNCPNVDFRGVKPVVAQMVADGQLLIGAGVTPFLRANTLASSDASVLITNGPGSIDLKTVAGPMLVPGVVNLGITYSAGTFTVTSATGVALSAANPGYVTLQSKTSGLVKTITVTADQSFIDDAGASTIIGNLFGLTTGVAVTTDMPFFIYAVLDDTETQVSFMISRIPGVTNSPAAAKIGKTGSAVADTQGGFFALGNPTVADYESNPCLLVGSMRMRMSAADDWTVQSLLSRDGIGQFQQGKQFFVPRGQFGAAASKHFKNNGGTAPDDADGVFDYFIEAQNNRIFFQLAYPSIDTGGVGAVTAQAALPYNRFEGATCGSGFGTAGGAYSFYQLETFPSSNTIQFPQVNPAASLLSQNTNFGLGLGVSFNGTITIDNV